MFSGHYFRRGTSGNLHKSAISKDGHGSKQHQILLACLRPGVIQSLDAKQAWLVCHAEAFPPHQRLAVCLLEMGPEDKMWPGLLSLSKNTIARYESEGDSHPDMYTNVGHK